jgi:hypothetical protein
MLFLVIRVVAFACLVQLHPKVAFPLMMVSPHLQPIMSAPGAASLWHWVRGGLGTQHEQFWEFTPSTVVWLRQAHCWLATSWMEEGWLGQSQMSTKAFLVALKICLQLHLCIEERGELQIGD